MDNRATKTSTRFGDMYVVKADAVIGRSLIEYGEWTQSEIFVLSQLIRPGMVVVDVGANVGTHTLAMAGMVGPKGWVVALEPQPFVFRLLSANLVMNGCENVVAINAGAGKSAGWLDVPNIGYQASGNYGSLELEPFARELDSPRGGAPVPLMRLDDIPAADKASLLKIDAERMEVPVIEGALELIGRNRPLLYVENEPAGENSERLIRSLMDLGYACFWDIARFFNADNFKRNPRNVFGNIVCVNMVCVPAEKPHSITNFSQVRDPTDYPTPRRAGARPNP
ncbi:MAG: FkbM family methyltransferase [Pseudomonadota bacterium]